MTTQPRKKVQPLKKNEEGEKELYKVAVVVHLISGKEREVDLGELNEQQIQNVNSTVMNAFGTIRTSDDLALSDFNATTYHFYIPNCECAEVRVG